MMRIPLFLVFVCWLANATAAPPTVAEFDETRAHVAAAQPEGLSMELKLPKTRFYQGELIPATLAFKNSSPSPNYTWIGTYDRSGRIRDLGFRAIGEQGEEVVDPLKKHFENGLFFGGGLGNYSALGEWEIKLNANEWLRFDRPGTYRLYGWSQRVTPGHNEDRFPEGAARPGPVGLVSGVVTIQIDPLPPAQEQELLEQIRKDLADNNDEVVRAALNRLRHLQTPASRDLSRSLLGHPRNYQPELGLIAAPDPQLEAANILRDVRAGLIPIGQSTLYLYRTLKKLADPAAVNVFAEAPASVMKELLDAARETLRGDLKSPVIAANLIALYTNDPSEPTARALVVAHQLELDDAATDSLIQRLSQEPQPGTDEKPSLDFLPLLRSAAGPPRNLPAALKALARLEPEEARKRIIEDIRNPPFKLRGHGGNISFDLEALCSLPKEMLLPELDATLRGRLGRKNQSQDQGIEATMMLVSRYASPALLPDVLRVYQPLRGRWACAIQADALRYILRCDPAAGVEELRQALEARSQTGCYHSVISDVLRRAWYPEALPLLLAALDDSNEEVWLSAVEMIALHAASPEAAAKLVATAERLGALPLPPKPSDQNTTLYRQDRLVKYLTEGASWKLTREQLTRLKALPNNRQDTRAALDRLLAN